MSTVPYAEEFTPEFFDESSAAWRENKKHVGEGYFKYKKGAFKEKPSKKKEESGGQTRLSIYVQTHSYSTRSKKKLDI